MASEMQKDQPPRKRPNRVLRNCNDGKYPSEFASLADEISSYIAHQLKLLWSGDGETIEFTSKVDLDHYCKLHHWDVDTAIALSLGQTAKKVRRYWHRFSTEFKHQHQCRKEALEQAILHNFIASDAQYQGTFFMKVRPVIKPLNFIKWAKQLNWELFFDMENLVRKYHIDDAIDWSMRCKELETENKVTNGSLLILLEPIKTLAHSELILPLVNGLTLLPMTLAAI